MRALLKYHFLSRYYLADLLSNTGDDAVAIAQINDQDATSFIVNQGLQFAYPQDIDAQWNSFIPIYANPNARIPWASHTVYLGPSLSLTYENGTSETQETLAILWNVDFSNISTGDDFYDAFINQDTTSSSADVSTAMPLQEKSKIVAPLGFFLDGTGFEDVAVLALTSFKGTDSNYLPQFQQTVESFLNQSRDAGKQRLVIDLTENLGGTIIAGFELFAQLFPDADTLNANDVRLSDSLVNISRIFSSLSEQEQENYVKTSPILDSLTPVELLRPQGEKFNTADEILSPVTLHGDNFSAYFRQPSPVDKFTLTGTGSRSNPPPAIFKPENVVLLTDGNCESTCTIFSYLMVFHANAKTVTVGGRPQTGQIQSIGGTEGSQVLDYTDISSLASQTISIVNDQAEADQLRQGELGTLAEGYAIKRASSPETSGTINYKNAFAPWDSKTPLQFMYEPANCHFFYTAQMLHSPELVWQYAVNATWTDADTYCVEGSITSVNTSQALDPAFLNPSHGANRGN